MVNVNGRWALIAGASRGIGRLSAKFMAQQGCNLILHSRKKEGTASLLEEVRAFGVEAYSVESELSDLDAVDAMLNAINACCSRQSAPLIVYREAPKAVIAFRGCFLEKNDKRERADRY